MVDDGVGEGGLHAHLVAPEDGVQHLVVAVPCHAGLCRSQVVGILRVGVHGVDGREEGRLVAHEVAVDDAQQAVAPSEDTSTRTAVEGNGGSALCRVAERLEVVQVAVVRGVCRLVVGKERVGYV